ncbi:hypothetical protein VK792_10145 [Mesobacterium sp. TK19101]|uniref:5-bromo-4-chloroindolyl phosphate hydrolysis protein n=1 Tax=Mesobacterium hydrothermale TaxID=3111907 RepID=A0ABU6HGR1_9RHOB|nr:hypothetical protein [Mesobacterium sp. TK19101]MEC3861645.1 hypothetical protein [Mesobacterium sp. TK19101]
MADISHHDGPEPRHDEPRSPNTVNVLLLALCPLIFWLFRGDIGSLVMGFLLLTLFGFAAHMIVTALEDEQVGLSCCRNVPRKAIGSAMIGAGAAILALMQGIELITSGGIGMLVFGLSVIAFGTDKGMEKRIRIKDRRSSAKETQKLIDTAERVLSAIPIRVAELEDEPSLLQARAFRDSMLRVLSTHPEVIEEIAPELRHVLTEAAEASDLFVEEYSEDPEPRIRRRYMVFLKTLADEFDACIQELTADDALAEAEQAREDALFDEASRKDAA